VWQASECCSEAHEHPICDQDSCVRGERGRQAPEGENDESTNERATTAVAVAERSGGDQKGGEAKCVPVHDPLQTSASCRTCNTWRDRQSGVEGLCCR